MKIFGIVFEIAKIEKKKLYLQSSQKRKL